MNREDLNHITKEYQEMRNKPRFDTLESLLGVGIGNEVEEVNTRFGWVPLDWNYQDLEKELPVEINRDFKEPIQKIPQALKKHLKTAKVIEYNH